MEAEKVYEGHLRKMPAEFDDVIRYNLELGPDRILMNALLGKKIRFDFDGQINCVVCGTLTKKAFGQGFCYPCFMNSPQNAECIIRPELCEGHLGKGRDPEWEKRNHVQPHFVYLALSSGLKVGITRDHQIPTRWIDQGANQAIIIAEVPYRQLSGLVEVALKEFYADRTIWQRMLKNEVTEDNLILKKEEALSRLPSELQQYGLEHDDLWKLNYPSLDTPIKVKSYRLEKVPSIEGVLTGIKGQYLILDNQNVINIRNHAGYFVRLSVING
ncbi:MAG: hypothetical protein ACI85F_000851 [Bacteroidia bacterium]|jgi:hypothetical protein